MKRYIQLFESLKYKGADLELVQGFGSRKEVKVTFYLPEEWWEFSSKTHTFTYKDMAKAKRVINEFNSMINKGEKIADIYSYIKLMSISLGY